MKDPERRHAGIPNKTPRWLQFDRACRSGALPIGPELSREQIVTAVFQKDDRNLQLTLLQLDLAANRSDYKIRLLGRGTGKSAISRYRIEHRQPYQP